MSTPKKILLTVQIIIIIVLSAIMVSCSTEKNFVKYHNNHDTTSAKYCSSWYPMQEKISTRTIYKPGTTRTIKGEDHVIYANCDSAYQAAYDEMARSGKKDQKIVVKNIPVFIPTSERVDTFFKDSVIIKESTAKLDIANGKINALQKLIVKQNEDTTKIVAEKDKWKKIGRNEGIVLALIVLTFVGSKVIK